MEDGNRLGGGQREGSLVSGGEGETKKSLQKEQPFELSLENFEGICLDVYEKIRKNKWDFG